LTSTNQGQDHRPVHRQFHSVLIKNIQQKESIMSHLSGRCTCGRVIHLPKGASRGTTWTCHNCGRTWHVSPYGNNPLHTRRSKAPPENLPAPVSRSGGGGGSDFDPTALVIGGIAAFLIAPSLCLVGAGLVGSLWAYKHFN
jgi:hypothetical protein